MRFTIDEDHCIETVELWCADHHVQAVWEPLWWHGEVIGWKTDCSDDDAMLLRMRYGWPQDKGRATLLDDAAFVGTTVVAFSR